MIYAAILKPDGVHADFAAHGTDARCEVRLEAGELVVHARAGDGSVRLRLGGPVLDAIRQALVTE